MRDMTGSARSNRHALERKRAKDGIPKEKKRLEHQLSSAPDFNHYSKCKIKNKKVK
jgi:hypothetical protein